MIEARELIPKFSRKDKDYCVWWTRFKLYAQSKKFDAALSNVVEPDLSIAHDTVLVETDTTQKTN